MAWLEKNLSRTTKPMANNRLSRGHDIAPNGSYQGFSKEFDFDWPLKSMTSMPDLTPKIVPLKTTVLFLTQRCMQRSKDRNKCVHRVHTVCS